MADVPLHRSSSPHRELARRYRHYAALQEFRVSVLLSLVTFAASMVTVYYAIQYATERASNPVSDIVLSNIPVFDVDNLFIYGTFAVVAFVTLLLFAHPKRIPFTLHAIAIFYFLRAGFISLTHIGPFPQMAVDGTMHSAVTNILINGADLFFSGHVGVTFLLALVFWKEKVLRAVFLLCSVFFSVVVLLGHYHYSIDVAAAFFITYTIFHIVEWLFPKDRLLFYADMPDEAR